MTERGEICGPVTCDPDGAALARQDRAPVVARSLLEITGRDPLDEHEPDAELWDPDSPERPPRRCVPPEPAGGHRGGAAVRSRSGGERRRSGERRRLGLRELDAQVVLIAPSR